MSTNVLDNLSHAVQAHADIIAAGTRQRMTCQRERSVRVAGGVGQRRMQMLQLVKPLSRNLQAERAHQCAESPINVVDGIRLDELPGFQDGLDASPGVARARAEQQFISGPLRQHVTQGGNRLGPQRRDVCGARLAAGIVDDSSAEIHGIARELGQLGGTIPAVQGQQDHRFHLDPRVAVASAAARGNSSVAGSQNAPDFFGGVQTPLHAGLLARGQLGDEPMAQTQGPTPVHIGGVVCGGAEVPQGTPGHLFAVPGVELGVELLDGIRADFIGEQVAGDGVNPLRPALVFHEASAAQVPALGLGAPVQQPLVQHDVDRHSGRGVTRHRNRLVVAGAPGSGLAVVNRQGVPRRLPAAHPAGFPAMPDDIAGRRHRERKTPRKRFGGPLHYAPLQNLMRDSQISVCFGGFPNVFPAPRALFISRLGRCAQVIDLRANTAHRHGPQPAISRTRDFPGKSPHHAQQHYALIRRSPAARHVDGRQAC